MTVPRYLGITQHGLALHSDAHTLPASQVWLAGKTTSWQHDKGQRVVHRGGLRPGWYAAWAVKAVTGRASDWTTRPTYPGFVCGVGGEGNQCGTDWAAWEPAAISLPDCLCTVCAD